MAARRARLLAALALPVLLAAIGCAEARAPQGPEGAVVAMRFAQRAGYQPTWTGVSLGGGQVVTCTPWGDEKPAFDRIDLLWGDGKTAEAEIVKVEEKWGMALLRSSDAAPPGQGPTVKLKTGDRVYLLGREEAPLVGTPVPEPRWAGRLREAEGEVTAVGVALPDPAALAQTHAPRPFLEIRVVGWSGLAGGLVLDSQRRSAAVVRLVQVAGTDKPMPSYALPLEEVAAWAQVAPPAGTPPATRAAYDLGQLVSAFRETLPGDDEVVALVDGEPVTRGTVRKGALAVRANQPGVDEGEARRIAFHTAAKRAVAVAEAKRRGLKVTPEESQQAVDYQRELWSKAPPEQRALLERDIADSGLTEDENWERFKENHARAALPMKLAQQRAEEAARARPLVQPPPFDDYLEELLKRARIEYRDQSLR